MSGIFQRIHSEIICLIQPPQFEMVLLDIPDDKTLIDESAEVEFEDSEEETAEAQIPEVKMSQEDLAVAGVGT